MKNDQVSVSLRPRLTCAEIEQHLDAYIDRELEPGLARDVDKHLDKCEVCRALVHDCIQIVDTARTLAECQIPREVSRRLHERLAEEMAKTPVKPALRIVDTSSK